MHLQIFDSGTANKSKLNVQRETKIAFPGHFYLHFGFSELCELFTQGCLNKMIAFLYIQKFDVLAMFYAWMIND